MPLEGYPNISSVIREAHYVGRCLVYERHRPETAAEYLERFRKDYHREAAKLSNLKIHVEIGDDALLIRQASNRSVVTEVWGRYGTELTLNQLLPGSDDDEGKAAMIALMEGDMRLSAMTLSRPNPERYLQVEFFITNGYYKLHPHPFDVNTVGHLPPCTIGPDLRPLLEVGKLGKIEKDQEHASPISGGATRFTISHYYGNG